MGRGRGRQLIALRERAAEILAEIQPATVRSVAYKLFSEGLIPNMSRRETGRVSRMLKAAREDGEIEWEAIVDNTRKPTWPGTYSSPMAFSGSVSRWWRQDPWEYQDQRIEVWSEKDTVSGVLAPVLDDFAVPFRVHRGFTSATAAHDIAEETTIRDKPLLALYVGDYDPSGLFMSAVDLPRRLEKYDADLDHFELRRIALTIDDCTTMQGLSFAASTKSRDPRYHWFLEHTGQRRCWELDAMNPNQLRARVRAAIHAEIDEVSWARVTHVDRAVQESLDTYMARWAQAKTISKLVQKYEGKA